MRMFDDHTSQAGGAVPPNLPIGEPEDIFAGVEPPAPEVDVPAPVSSSSAPEITVPAPVVTKTALSAGVLKPKEDSPLDVIPEMAVPQQISSVAPPEMASAPPTPVRTPASVGGVAPATQTHTMPSDVPEMYAVKEPRASKGIITAIVVIVVVLVLGGGGVFVYNQFVANPSNSDEFTDLEDAVAGTGSDTNTDFFEEININVQEEEKIENIPDSTATDTADRMENDILFGEPVDTDADGLDDEREKDLGTDVAHWDTDGDELSDGDEVIIWKTDPLNPDTDGDGFTDGAEIKNGYSPTGEGKIFEPPTDDTTTTTP